MPTLPTLQRISLPLLLLALWASGCSEAAEGGETYSYVFSQLRFARVVDGALEGVDVDGRNSDSSDGTTCSIPDGVSIRGEGGIDNQLAAVLPFIDDAAGGDPDGLIQGAINDGSLILLLEITGVNDRMNDEDVEVQLHIGMGETLVGSGGALIPYQSFFPDPSFPASPPAPGRIRDGRLEAGPVSTVIPIAILNVAFELEIAEGRVDIEFDEEGNGIGFMGGAVPRETFHEVVTAAVNGDQGMAEFLINIVDGLADLEKEDGICTKVSAGLGVGAIPAFVVRHEPDAGP